MTRLQGHDLVRVRAQAAERARQRRDTQRRIAEQAREACARRREQRPIRWCGLPVPPEMTEGSADPPRADKELADVLLRLETDFKAHVVACGGRYVKSSCPCHILTKTVCNRCGYIAMFEVREGTWCSHAAAEFAALKADLDDAEWTMYLITIRKDK